MSLRDSRDNEKGSGKLETGNLKLETFRSGVAMDAEVSRHTLLRDLRVPARGREKSLTQAGRYSLSKFKGYPCPD
jgi:hypothetical protein